MAADEKKESATKKHKKHKTDSSLQQFVPSVSLRGYRFGFLSACIRVYPRLLIDADKKKESTTKKHKKHKNRFLSSTVCAFCASSWLSVRFLICVYPRLSAATY